VYRLTRHGRWIGDYKSVEELGKHVDLSTLVEDTAGGVEEPNSLENGDGPAMTGCRGPLRRCRRAAAGPIRARSCTRTPPMIYEQGLAAQ
jgi:hypothetical protein